MPAPRRNPLVADSPSHALSRVFQGNGLTESPRRKARKRTNDIPRYRFSLTDYDKAPDETLPVALDNAIECELSNQPERKPYWLRCAMLAQDELGMRS